MLILAIDPGTEKSAYVLWDGGRLLEAAIVSNLEMLIVIIKHSDAILVIEMFACYGMAVGQTVFETVFWIGRFYQHGKRMKMTIDRIFRKECKMELCGNNRAKDSNIRHALIDKLGEIGTKNKPGPLYLIRGSGGKDIWSALAIAVTYEAKMEKKEAENILPF